MNQKLDHIGKVTKMTGNIAGRTNLLALNATSQTAHADGACKGFAVAASEVKKLATQTVLSTEEITPYISEMQGSVANSEAHTRSLFETAPVMLHSLDSRGRLIDISQEWLTNLGYARDEVLGRPVTDFLLPASRSLAILVVEPALLAKGRCDGIEYQVLTKGGEVINVLLSAVLERDASGQHTHSVAVMTNVAGGRGIERALHKSEAFLDKVGLLAGVGCWEIDMATSEIYWSDETCRIHGVSPGYRPTLEETIGYYAPEARDVIAAAVEHCIRTGAPWDLELPLVRADGRLIHVRAMGSPEYHGSRLLRLFGAFQDVTEHRRLRERLLQNQKVQAIGQLAIGVAHDFNNILQTISGVFELLGDDITKPSEQSELRDLAQKAAARGGYLTQHLLSYTRQQMLQPKLVYVGTLVADITRMLRRTIGPHIEIVHDGGGEAGAVFVDRAMLETALINLAINASHAMPNGGRLTFSSTCQQVDDGAWLSAGVYTVIRVEDTGSGIPENLLNRVFDPFFTTKGTEGTGLGLPMVQGFARQNRGDVRLSSVPNIGTTVEFWLPCSGFGDRPSAAAAEQQGAQAVGMRVLLVDDDVDVLKLIGLFLSRCGLQVVSAENAAAALSILADRRDIDLLVTDYAMPGMNGLELINAVEATGGGVACMLITGYAAIESIENRQLSVLSKPFQMSDLRAVIENFAEQKRKAGGLLDESLCR